MIPYKSHLATAVPEALNVRLEILKAVCKLASTQDDERLRQRRTAPASMRRELAEIALPLHELGRECDPRLRSHVLKYDPDQPRVPVRNPAGGQWTSDTQTSLLKAQRIPNTWDGRLVRREVKAASFDPKTKTRQESRTNRRRRPYRTAWRRRAPKRLMCSPSLIPRDNSMFLRDPTRMKSALISAILSWKDSSLRAVIATLGISTSV